ncbi:TPA: hypothetical protein ACH3X2_000461 [Trebouxia sp. C0005]
MQTTMCKMLLTVIHEAPRILEFLLGCCLKLLQQTNQEMRQEVDSFVKTISPDHAALLTQQDWPRLRNLQLRHCFLDSAEIGQLVTASFPQLERLHLAGALLLDPGALLLDPGALLLDPGALSLLCNASPHYRSNSLVRWMQQERQVRQGVLGHN